MVVQAAKSEKIPAASHRCLSAYKRTSLVKAHPEKILVEHYQSRRRAVQPNGGCKVWHRKPHRSAATRQWWSFLELW